MKQYDKIKKDINKCETAMEMVGYLDGVYAASIIYCKQNYPDEIYIKGGDSKVSICGMKYFLESEIND